MFPSIRNQKGTIALSWRTLARLLLNVRLYRIPVPFIAGNRTYHRQVQQFLVVFREIKAAFVPAAEASGLRKPEKAADRQVQA